MVATQEALDFGAKLRKSREGLGLSQEDLASIVDKSHGRIQQYEQGDRVPWELEMALAELFGWDGYIHDPALAADMEERLEAIQRLKQPLRFSRGRYCGSPIHKMIQRRGAAGIKAVA